jgi:hypothetical protein
MDRLVFLCMVQLNWSSAPWGESYDWNAGKGKPSETQLSPFDFGSFAYLGVRLDTRSNMDSV